MLFFVITRKQKNYKTHTNFQNKVMIQQNKTKAFGIVFVYLLWHQHNFLIVLQILIFACLYFLLVQLHLYDKKSLENRLWIKLNNKHNCLSKPGYQTDNNLIYMHSSKDIQKYRSLRLFLLQLFCFPCCSPVLRF